MVGAMFAGAMAGKQNIFEINFTRNFLPFLWMWFLFACALLAVLLGAVKGRIPPAACTAVILALGIVDIVRVDATFIKLVSPAPYFRREQALSPLIDRMKQEPFRVFSLPGALPQNGAGIHHLEGVGGFHDNELHWYREFRGDQQDRNYLSSLVGTGANGQPYLRAEMLSAGNPFLNIANVKYLLLRNGSQLTTVPNEHALGRISFVSGYAVMDSSGIAQALATGDYDYRRKVALEAEPRLPEGFELPPKNAPPDTSLQARWDAYTPNYRKVTVKAPSAGFIRISEVYYPAWEIRVDGKRVRPLRADLAWMAIPALAGTHVIEMKPHSNYAGIFGPVTFTLSGGILLYWIVAVLGRLKRRTAAAPALPAKGAKRDQRT